MVGGIWSLYLLNHNLSVAGAVGFIAKADPQALVEIDLASHHVRVETTEDRETIASAVAEAGYVPD